MTCQTSKAMCPLTHSLKITVLKTELGKQVEAKFQVPSVKDWELQQAKGLHCVQMRPQLVTLALPHISNTAVGGLCMPEIF